MNNDNDQNFEADLVNNDNDDYDDYDDDDDDDDEDEDDIFGGLMFENLNSNTLNIHYIQTDCLWAGVSR